MRKNWFITILGLWLIVLGLLGLSSSFQKILIIITGAVISLVSFWKGTNDVVRESMEKLKEDEKLSQ